MGNAEPIPTRLAAAAGLTPRQLRSKRWVTPFHGVRIDRSAAGDLHAVCLALVAVARVPVVISDRTTAELYEWWLPRQPVQIIDVTVAPEHVIERPGVRCHRRVLDPCDVRELGGITVTSPVRTILDLAGHLPLIDLVVVIDSALQKRTCTLQQLLARANDRGVRGIARYRRALELCDGRSESAPETMTRLVIVLSGLPAPTPQFNVYDPKYGFFVARTDLRAFNVRAAQARPRRQAMARPTGGRLRSVPLHGNGPLRRAAPHRHRLPARARATDRH